MQNTNLKSGISLFLFQDDNEEVSSRETDGDDLEKDLPLPEEEEEKADGDWGGGEDGEDSEGLPEV